MLVSINRKTFLRSVADRSTEDALPVSLAATSMAVERGAHIVRTHDVSETVDAALVGDTFTRARSHSGRDQRTDGDITVEELDVTTPGEAARHFERAGITDADPGTAVSRVYSVGGLDDSTRERLRTAASAAGCRFVATPDGDEGLLCGSCSSLASLADRTDVPRPLAGTLAADGATDR
jgi:dihydropteroate synthase